MHEIKNNNNDNLEKLPGSRKNASIFFPKDIPNENEDGEHVEK